MRVIVTRPEAQAAAWVDALRAAGVDAVALPLIAIEPLADATPLQAAWATLAGRALVVFVSANAVQQFFARRGNDGATWPVPTLAGATGPGTAAALRAAAVPPACIVEPAPDAPAHDSEALWERLRERDWAGRSVLIVRGDGGRDWLASTLRGRGAAVDFVTAYCRHAPRWSDAQRAWLGEALAAPARHLWAFSSSEAIGHLGALAPGTDWSRARAVATHARIARSARDAGFGRVDEVGATPAALAAFVTAAPIQSGPL